jgi:hypothetical protein
VVVKLNQCKVTILAGSTRAVKAVKLCLCCKLVMMAFYNMR